MNYNINKLYSRFLFKSLFIILVILCSFFVCSNVHAKTTKIKYNNSTYKYTGRIPIVKLDGNKINTHGIRNIMINNIVMVPYDSVFSRGCSVKVTKNKSGEITFKANGKTVKMTVGSKTAYVGDKKKKLSQAPLKVFYIKKSKTKILVPIQFIAEALGYTYYDNTQIDEIMLTSPFVLTYGDSLHIYKKYMGSFVYNNTPVDLSEMPSVSIGGTTMIPAEQIFSKVMGIKYNFAIESGEIKISNDYYSVSMTVGSKELSVTDKTKDETIKPSVSSMISAPVVVKRNDTSFSCLMVPASDVCKALGYYYSWNKTLKTSYVHSKDYFIWNSSKKDNDSKTFSNSVKSIHSYYDLKNTNIIFEITCANNIDSNKVVIAKDSTANVINIDLYDSNNLLSNKTYEFASKNIESFNSSQSGLGSRFVLNIKEENIKYKYTVKDNVVTILLGEEWNSDYALRINKPEMVPFDHITLDDRYYENKFVLCIPGNNVDFYSENPIIKNSLDIEKFNIVYDVTNDVTKITVSTSKLLGVKLIDLGNVIGVIADKPSNVFDNIVILDPGHGGTDPGARSNGTRECDLNLSIIYECAKKYFNESNLPIKAYWTRVNDTFITLDDRAAYAGKIGADIFVSLHMNSATNSSAKGTEVYYCSTNNHKTDSGINSKKLADKLLTNIIGSVSTSNRGVKTANFYVIKNNTVPAVLIELGFISNSTDYKIITSKEKQELAAKAIYDAIISFIPF